MFGKGKKGPSPAYNQTPATPSCPQYPVQQGPPMAPMGAPPAYTPTPPPGHQSYPQQPYYPGGAVPQPQMYPQNQYGQAQQAYPVAPAMQGYYPPPAGQTVVMPGLFDAGARFDGGAQPTIPPPPPGCAPNPAQMAAMQGHTVVGTQQRGNFWTDGSGGGVSFW